MEQLKRGRGEQRAAEDGGVGVGQRVGGEVDVGEVRQREQRLGEREAQLPLPPQPLLAEAQPRREGRAGSGLAPQRDPVAIEGEGGEGGYAAAPG